MEKSPDAFRTISEVAEILETPAHVLRFWESRFPQIRPVKRAGGRRYYRPTDVALLTGIKHLLHDEGLTIRGVQKMLREQGVRHVAGLSGQDVPDESASAEAALEAALAANFAPPAAQVLPQEAAESAQIVALETALKARRVQAAEPADVVAAEATPPTAIPAADPEPPIAEAAAKPAAARADELPLFARMAPPAAAPLQLVDRLRQLPPGSLDTPAARALRDRLASLQVRVAAPPAANPL
jgi:DNA-binding transcriptional MerR regulator